MLSASSTGSTSSTLSTSSTGSTSSTISASSTGSTSSELFCTSRFFAFSWFFTFMLSWPLPKISSRTFFNSVLSIFTLSWSWEFFVKSEKIVVSKSSAQPFSKSASISAGYFFPRRPRLFLISSFNSFFRFFSSSPGSFSLEFSYDSAKIFWKRFILAFITLKSSRFKFKIKKIVKNKVRKTRDNKRIRSSREILNIPPS